MFKGRENYILIGLFSILGILIIKKAFMPTYAAFQSYWEASAHSLEQENFETEISENQELIDIHQELSKNIISENEMERQIVELGTTLLSTFNCRIIGIDQLENRPTNGYNLSLYKITMEGEYAKLVNSINYLEQSLQSSKIRSVQLSVEKGTKSNKTLVASLYIQSLYANEHPN